MQFTPSRRWPATISQHCPIFPLKSARPQGTLAGVSGFQLNFSSSEIFTAGDEPNVLVAMNPAALQANIEDVPPNAVIIVDREAFTDSNLKRAGYKTNPLTDHSLDKFQVIEVDVTKLTSLAVHGMGLNNRAVFRCRNMFVLGMLSWLYQRPIESTLSYLESRFKKTPEILEANVKRAQGRIQLRRDHRDVRELVRSAGRANRAGIVSQYHRQQRDRAGIRGGGGEIGTSAVPGLVSDHARQRHPARTLGLQEFPRLYFPGRGRDCRRMRGDRRVIRRMRSQSPRLRAPA